jgi:DNA-binding beta-propeller fold protein YncE
MSGRICAVLVLAAGIGEAQHTGKIASGLERRLYVTDASGISIYDINDGHRLLGKIDVPGTGDYKGIAASVPLGKLYVTSHREDELVSIDLVTETVSWRKKYGRYPDSMAITPDGKTLYLPFREEDSWWVIDAAGGDVIAKIPVGRGKNYDVNPIANPVGPHNTWSNPSGSRMYLEVLTLPYVFIADTASNRIIGKVGPFSKGIRPFAVTDDEKYVFANVDGLLGFEVGAVRDGSAWGGGRLYRMEATTPADRVAQIKNPPAHKPHSTPSHGLNLTPDQKEVWVVDGVYGYVYAYDVAVMPRKYIAGVPLYASPEERPHPGWITFSIDGRMLGPTVAL